MSHFYVVSYRVVQDTELAGYPAAGYPANLFCRISGWIIKGRHKKNFYSFRNCFVIFSGDLGFEERINHVKFFWPDIRQTKLDIRPDTGCKKCRISGATLTILPVRSRGISWRLTYPRPLAGVAWTWASAPRYSGGEGRGTQSPEDRSNTELERYLLACYYILFTFHF